MVQVEDENDPNVKENVYQHHHNLAVRPRRSRLTSESSMDGMENLVPLELDDLRRFSDHSPPNLCKLADRKMPLLRVAEVDSDKEEGKEMPKSDTTTAQRAKRNWKIALKSVNARKDPWADMHWDNLPVENAIRHKYNPVTKKWKEEPVVVKIEKDSFGKGAMRECFRIKKLSNFTKNRIWNRESNNFVAKSYLEETSKETYFQDVKLQMDAKLWSEEYNRHNPPKKVDIVMMSVLEFHERNERPLYHIEHFIEGDYVKYNSNSGFVEETKARQTPHAFSHFTFERSGHELIVVDVQGVGDLYTDPQIHTAEGMGYGDGNLGTRGMALFFHSHRCNEICFSLGLTPFDLNPTELEKKALRKNTETIVNSEKLLCCESPTDIDKEDFSSFFRKRRNSNSEILVDIEAARNAAKLYRRQRTYSDYHSIEEMSPTPISSALGESSEDFDFECGDTIVSETSSCVSWIRRRKMTESSDDSGIVASRHWSCFHDQVANKAKPANLDYLHRDEMSIHDDRILGQVHLDLAVYHEMGRFVTNGEEVDKKAALFHLGCAADCGLVTAMKNLAFIYYKMPHDILAEIEAPEAGTEEGQKIGFHYMEEAAKAGDRSSMVFLARCYDSGLNLDCSKRKSAKTAIDWYEKICEMDMDEVGKTEWGMDDAPYLLLSRQAEIWLEGGEDVVKDPKLAGDLFSSAAESAMNCMKGKLANKYYVLAEEAYAQCGSEE